MSVWEWIRVVAGGALLFAGLLIFLIEVYGVFRFRYVLNRMHAAAMGDTLGIGCSMAGLMLFSGFNLASMKMAMVVLFLWLASPVSSHLLARLEAGTNEKLGEHCQVYEDLKELEAERNEETGESFRVQRADEKSGEVEE